MFSQDATEMELWRRNLFFLCPPKRMVQWSIALDLFRKNYGCNGPSSIQHSNSNDREYHVNTFFASYSFIRI